MRDGHRISLARLYVKSANYASKDAGTNIAVTATDTLSGANMADYSLIEPTSLSGTITPAPLTVSGTSARADLPDLAYQSAGVTIALELA